MKHDGKKVQVFPNQHDKLKLAFGLNARNKYSLYVLDTQKNPLGTLNSDIDCSEPRIGQGGLDKLEVKTFREHIQAQESMVNPPDTVQDLQS